MNFERGGDIKETLKIGRKANAIKVKYFEVKGEVVVTLDPSSITEEMILKYNLKDKSHIKFSQDFVMTELALETALIILNKSGICKDFNDYISELIAKVFLKRDEESKRGFRFDKNKDPLIKVVWVLVVAEENVDLPKSIREKFQLTFNRTGLDLLYKNQLYRIALPKDGGLDE